jgi:hypothetical protein
VIFREARFGVSAAEMGQRFTEKVNVYRTKTQRSIDNA